MSESKFSATDATLGYAYQVRCALLYSLLSARNGEEFQVGVETLDDVAFSSSNDEPVLLLQTKHHLSNKSLLTNAAPDLWKTLRIWIEGRSSGDIPETAKLYLITTATASGGSAAEKLRGDANVRDVAAAAAALGVTARTSTSESNSKAYLVFLQLTAEERHALLSQAFVIDASPNITDLDENYDAKYGGWRPRGWRMHFWNGWRVGGSAGYLSS